MQKKGQRPSTLPFGKKRGGFLVSKERKKKKAENVGPFSTRKLDGEQLTLSFFPWKISLLGGGAILCGDKKGTLGKARTFTRKTTAAKHHLQPKKILIMPKKSSSEYRRLTREGGGIVEKGGGGKGKAGGGGPGLLTKAATRSLPANVEKNNIKTNQENGGTQKGKKHCWA